MHYKMFCFIGQKLQGKFNKSALLKAMKLVRLLVILIYYID